MAPAQTTYQSSFSGNKPRIAADRRLAIARYYENLGSIEKAREFYLSVLKSDPNNNEAHRRLAGIAVRQEQDQEAEQYYMRALSLAPDDPYLLYDVAHWHYMRNRLKDAERALLRSMAANTRSAPVQASQRLGHAGAAAHRGEALDPHLRHDSEVLLRLIRSRRTPTPRGMNGQSLPGHGGSGLVLSAEEPASGRSRVMQGSLEVDDPDGGQDIDDLNVSGSRTETPTASSVEVPEGNAGPAVFGERKTGFISVETREEHWARTDSASSQHISVPEHEREHSTVPRTGRAEIWQNGKLIAYYEEPSSEADTERSAASRVSQGGSEQAGRSVAEQLEGPKQRYQALIDTLIASLKDQDPHLRKAAALALGSIYQQSEPTSSELPRLARRSDSGKGDVQASLLGEPGSDTEANTGAATGKLAGTGVATDQVVLAEEPRDKDRDTAFSLIALEDKPEPIPSTLPDNRAEVSKQSGALDWGPGVVLGRGELGAIVAGFVGLSISVLLLTLALMCLARAYVARGNSTIRFEPVNNTALALGGHATDSSAGSVESTPVRSDSGRSATRFPYFEHGSHAQVEMLKESFHADLGLSYEEEIRLKEEARREEDRAILRNIFEQNIELHARLRDLQKAPVA